MEGEQQQMPMNNQVEEQFKSTWKTITEKVTLSDLEAEPYLKRWWPTISYRNDLNWNMLTQNFLALGNNPFAALLHCYAMGMAHALEGIDDESFLPLQRLDAEQIPEWLTRSILEGIIAKYGDEHYNTEKDDEYLWQ